MKFLAIGIMMVLHLTAQGYAPAESAFLLKDGERTAGLFQPKRYGLNEKYELSTLAWFFPLYPNACLKMKIRQSENRALSVRGTAAYPTLLLNLIQKEGTLGILADDPDIDDIPQMMLFRSELLMSIKQSSWLVTGKMGITACLGGKQMDERLTVDYPMAYPRILTLMNGWALNMGLDGRYALSNKWQLLADGDFFVIPGMDDDRFFEHKLLFARRISRKLSIESGYKLSWGEYPWGTQWYLVPVVDLVWNWDRNN